MADIPGLIEGAADGAGLGHQFLKHLSRCQCLLHLVALTSDEPNYQPTVAWQAVNEELRKYTDDFAHKPQLLVLTKSDTLDEAGIEAIIEAFKALGQDEVFVISSFTRQGIDPMMTHLGRMIQASHIERY